MKMKMMLLTITLALGGMVAAQAQEQPLPQSSPQQQAEQTAAPAQAAPAQKKGVLSKIFGQGSKPKKSEAKSNDAQSQLKDTPQPKDASSRQPEEAQEIAVEPARNDARPPQSEQPQAVPAGQSEAVETGSRPAASTSAEKQATPGETTTEDEAKVASSYGNFFSTYRLGPEDVISVEVFNQPRYSRPNITIPPNGRISLSLIPGGITVSGKTVEEVAEIIRQKYEEYIVDASVSVSLDKAVSYRYSVIGDVAQPGIKPLSRRMTVREALAEAGGVLNTGDTSKVAILRRLPDGRLDRIQVNVKKILQGKIPDDAYLSPGDQVVVPGNTFKKVQQVMNMLPILSFARIFTGGW
jgi:polysaccharide export outer membrane protein